MTKVKIIGYIFTLLLFTALIIPPGCNQADSPKKTTPKQHVTPKKTYSKNESGEWEKYADDHAPKIEYTLTGNYDNLLIYVILKDPSKNHYIEEIGYLNKKNRKVESRYFGRQNRKNYSSRFSLAASADRDKYTAYARCNLHDLWITPLPDAKVIKANK
jgi:desulfoferrodoxin (superoxide reductase-like protein)